MICSGHLDRRLDPKLALPNWLAPAVQAHLQRVEYECQVREFSEEMARISFLPPAERRREIAELVDHARRKGVKFEKPAHGVQL